MKLPIAFCLIVVGVGQAFNACTPATSNSNPSTSNAKVLQSLPRTKPSKVIRDKAGKDSIFDQAKNYATKYSDRKQYNRAFYFDKRTMNELLNQPNCEGVRIYFTIGNKDAKKGKPTFGMVAVGVDANGVDLIDRKTTTGKPYILSNGFILYPADKCPESCDAGSALDNR